MNKPGKVKPTKIELYRLQARNSSEIGASVVTGNGQANLWRQAAAVLRGWATTAPTHGHDDVRFVITWADGQTHEGRFALELTDLGNVLFSAIARVTFERAYPPEPEKRDHTMLSRHVRCFFDYLAAARVDLAADVQAFRDTHDLDDEVFAA